MGEDLEVTESRKGYIVNEDVILSEIRGAIVGPDLDNPGYCVFFGRKLDGPLFFLSEIREKVQGDLVNRVVEESKKLFCHSVYVNFGQEELFTELYGKLDATKVYPHFPYPFEEDLEAGIVRIRQHAFRKQLEIPNGTILSGQLGNVAPDRLKELDVYALTALHYLIVWFQKVAPPKLIEEYRERKTKENRTKLKKSLDTVSRVAMNEIEEIEKAIKAGYDPSSWGDMEREAWRHNG